MMGAPGFSPRALARSFLERYEARRARLMERGVFGRMRGRSGYVLVIVLIISAMLISVSTEFLITAQTNINYSLRFSNRLKAFYLARTGVQMARFILEADKRGLTGMITGQSVDRNIDCFQDLWALELPEIPLESGTLRLRIGDENSKINLSILANEFVDRTQYYNMVQRFFMNMGFPIDMADTILDWVDIDDTRSPYGAESADYYQSLAVPFKAKNREMDSIDELLLIKGMTPEVVFGLGGGNFGKEPGIVDDNMGVRKLNTEILKKTDPDAARKAQDDFARESRTADLKVGREKSRRLSDYFRAHGERSDYLGDYNKININTASYRVLSALTDNMTDDIVSEIIRRRNVRPFSSVSEVRDLISDDNVLNNMLTVKSFIFRIEATATVDNASVTITAYYSRDDKKILYWAEE